MKITEIFDDPTLRMGAIGSLLITVYRANATNEVLDQVERAQSAMLRDFAKISALAIVPDIVKMARVEEPVKRRSLEMMRQFDDHLHGTATVILARGLGAAIIRTFMTAFNITSRSASPSRTFGDVSAAVTWLSTLPEQDGAFGHEAEIIEAIAAFAA